MIAYVEKNTILQRLRDLQEKHPIDGTDSDRLIHDACSIISDFVEQMPAAQVVAYRHAHWIPRMEDGRPCLDKNGDPVYECSSCKRAVTQFDRTTYCPKCGAHMHTD